MKTDQTWLPRRRKFSLGLTQFVQNRLGRCWRGFVDPWFSAGIRGKYGLIERRSASWPGLVYWAGQAGMMKQRISIFRAPSISYRTMNPRFYSNHVSLHLSLKPTFPGVALLREDQQRTERERSRPEPKEAAPVPRTEVLYRFLPPRASSRSDFDFSSKNPSGMSRPMEVRSSAVSRKQLIREELIQPAGQRTLPLKQELAIFTGIRSVSVLNNRISRLFEKRSVLFRSTFALSSSTLPSLTSTPLGERGERSRGERGERGERKREERAERHGDELRRTKRDLLHAPVAVGVSAFPGVLLGNSRRSAATEAFGAASLVSYASAPMSRQSPESRSQTSRPGVSQPSAPVLHFYRPLNLSSAAHRTSGRGQTFRNPAEEPSRPGSAGEAQTSASQTAMPSDKGPLPQAVDLSQLSDQVYRLLERKLQRERERRGIYG